YHDILVMQLCLPFRDKSNLLIHRLLIPPSLFARELVESCVNQPFYVSFVLWKFAFFSVLEQSFFGYFVRGSPGFTSMRGFGTSSFFSFLTENVFYEVGFKCF